jgi:uncharacterized Zn finger protein (UPF0148 family)
MAKGSTACPREPCDGFLAEVDGALRCPRCDATFTSRAAVETERSEARLKEVRAEFAELRRRLRDGF